MSDPVRIPCLPGPMHARVDSIIRDVAELPDRTSPDDQPDLMLVTDAELRDILWRHLEGLSEV